MKVRNNYDECVTSLACSIRKYFELPYKHKTLPSIDALLEQYQPQNVVVILLDAMGTNIMERTLPKDAWLRRNLQQSITTVFPATTTAATTSMRTGLNPVEHGWLGWTSYIEPIDKVITMFLNSEKDHDGEICEEYLDAKNKLVNKTITDEINDAGKFQSVELMPFGDDPYDGLDDMLQRIRQETRKPGKKYIYAYDDEPDSSMHLHGPDSPESQKAIKERNATIAELAKQLQDTLLIVVADHGHMKTETVFLKDYPDLMSLLVRPTSIDQRAVSFKVKEGKKEEFRRLFEQNFGDCYMLYDAQDVIDSRLFGDGPENELYRAALGDFIGIATGNKSITAPGDEVLASHHAGYTDDEIFIPIVVEYCKGYSRETKKAMLEAEKLTDDPKTKTYNSVDEAFDSILK